MAVTEAQKAILLWANKGPSHKYMRNLPKWIEREEILELEKMGLIVRLSPDHAFAERFFILSQGLDAIGITG